MAQHSDWPAAQVREERTDGHQPPSGELGHAGVGAAGRWPWPLFTF